MKIRRYFVKFLCCFILEKKERNEFRDKYLYKRVRLKDIKIQSNPIELWAFIRVKNEIKTIDVSLKSILPAIKKV